MFTEKQLKNFSSYRRVQMSGKWNMFDPRACRATGLSDEEYTFVMNNYIQLRDAVDGALLPQA